MDTPANGQYFTQRDRRIIQQSLEKARHPVSIQAFVDLEQSRRLRGVLVELTRLSHGRLDYEEILHVDHPLAHVLEVTARPTLRFLNSQREWAPVEFVGEPSGYQFGALLGLILSLAGHSSHRVAPRVISAARNLRRDVTLEVLTLPTCPHSPHVVRLTQELALANPARIRARAISVVDQPEWAALGVEAVPHLRIISRGALLATHTGALTADMLWRLVHTQAKGGHL
ncbi:MAG: hypothetical protein OWU84_01575 [Firmicutes bacterium]|nr:hypothetical protein [Bacillota bacterium]